jgi:hypothetical protein
MSTRPSPTREGVDRSEGRVLKGGGLSLCHPTHRSLASCSMRALALLLLLARNASIISASESTLPYQRRVRRSRLCRPRALLQWVS